MHLLSLLSLATCATAGVAGLNRPNLHFQLHALNSTSIIQKTKNLARALSAEAPFKTEPSGYTQSPTWPSVTNLAAQFHEKVTSVVEHINKRALKAVAKAEAQQSAGRREWRVRLSREGNLVCREVDQEVLRVGNRNVRELDEVMSEGLSPVMPARACCTTGVECDDGQCYACADGEYGEGEGWVLVRR